MGDNLPSIPVDTTPTQPRSTPQSKNTPTSKANGPSNTLPPSYRLLYRGSLSLPDSLLLLDGLTFAARLNSPSKTSTFNLLQNPLALALESMRGRPSLRLMGTVPLRDVWLDESGGVEMDIHPHATLTRIYFENMFCLLPFSASSSKSVEAQRSEIGIKVALGDSNGPETTEIVIFAQLNSTGDSPNTVQLSVARLTQRPLAVQVQKRVPRPDDPTPRKPPILFLQGLKRAGSLGSGRELKRVASGNIIGVGATKRQKLTNGAGVAADLGSGVRLGVVNAEDDQVFKVPDLPGRTGGKLKGKEKEDVFGNIADFSRVSSVEGQSGKGKQKPEEGPMLNEVAFEKVNKNTIKRATIEYLNRTKDPTNPSRFIDKTHSDFKELYGFVYRGVGYALRAKIRNCEIDLRVMNRLIDKHALMYLGGCGGSAVHADNPEIYNIESHHFPTGQASMDNDIRTLVNPLLHLADPHHHRRTIVNSMPIFDSPDFGHTFVPINSLTSSPRSSIGSTSVLEWNSDSGSECGSAHFIHPDSSPVPRIPSQVSPNTTSPKEYLSSGHSQTFASSKFAAPRVDGTGNDVTSSTSVDEYHNLLGALEGRFTLQDSTTQWQDHSYRQIVGLHTPETPSPIEHSGNVAQDEQYNSAAPSPDLSVATESSISAVTVTQPLHASSLFLPPAPLTSHVYPAAPAVVPSVVPNHNKSENISIAQYFQLKGATEEAEPVQPPVVGPPRPISAASCLSYTSTAESPIQTPVAVPPPDVGVEPPLLNETWPDFISRMGKDSVSTTGCTRNLPRSPYVFTYPKTSSYQVCGEGTYSPHFSSSTAFDCVPDLYSSSSRKSQMGCNNIGPQSNSSTTKATPPSSQGTDALKRNLKNHASSMATRRVLPSISCKFEDGTPARKPPIKPSMPSTASLPSAHSRHPPYMISPYDPLYGKIPKLINRPVPPSSLQGISSVYPTFNCQIPPPPALPQKYSYNGAETRDIGQASPGSTNSGLPFCGTFKVPKLTNRPVPSSLQDISSTYPTFNSQIPPPPAFPQKRSYNGAVTWDIGQASPQSTDSRLPPPPPAVGARWPSPTPSGSPMSASAVPPSPSQVDLRSAHLHHATATGGSNDPPSNVPFVSRTPSPTPAFNGAYPYPQTPPWALPNSSTPNPWALPNPGTPNPYGTRSQFPYTPRYTGSTLPRDMHLCAGPPTWGPTPRRLRFAPLPPTPSAGVSYAGIPSSTLPYTTPLPSYPLYPPYPYQAPQLPAPLSPPYSSRRPGTTTNSQHWTPHPVFSYSDGSIVFRIGNVGYKVHRHFFERHSTYFRDLLAHPKYTATSPVPHVIHLWDVTKVDFERLLLLFYPSNLVDPELFSIEEWTSILMLSNKWNFAQLKTLAIRELGYITTNIEKIALAKEYNVGNPQWLLAAYRDLCTRRYPLSLLEAEQLGLETVIKIWEVQHELTTGFSSWGRSADIVIQEKFGLF